MKKLEIRKALEQMDKKVFLVLNLTVNDAFKKILVEFPDVSKEELITWYREEKEKEGKGGDFFDLSR